MDAQPESDENFVFESFGVKDFLHILEILLQIFFFFVVDVLKALVLDVEQLQSKNRLNE